MKIFRGILKYWLPLAVAISLLSGVLYITIQQILRLGGNEPQVQLAEDAAAALAAGQPLESVLPAGKVDLAHSLAPYLIIYDTAGQVLASNAVLNGSTPNLPAGVLETTRKNGEDRITWQPAPSVRSAVVVVPVNGGAGGFVLAGRSLREAEKRIDLLGLQVLSGWLGTLAATLVLVVLLELLPFTRGG